ncbi:MAG: hypothetical protein ABR926_16510 [Streptosporangiaceae bacterium]|jgi:hypothetical protein
MDRPGMHPGETFNPWSVVNLVFHHLADQGLHPVLGESGDPGAPAAELLRALGIEPAAEGNPRQSRDIQDQLAELRNIFFGER